MTGPQVGGIDWNKIYGVDSDIYRQEYAAYQQGVAGWIDFWHQAQAGRTGAQQPTPTPRTVPVEPANPRWTDEDLVGAATYWGMEEGQARAMPRNQVIDYVNHMRDANRSGGASKMAEALAPLGMFGVGATEAITGGIQNLPGIGAWLSKQTIVHQADLKVRQLEEGIRSSTPESWQTGLSAANIAGNIAASAGTIEWLSGTKAWIAAAKIGEAMPLASKLTPLGRAAFKGGLSSYLLAGGTKDDDQNPWMHRAVVVGMGVGIGMLGIPVAKLAQKVTNAYVAPELLQPGDLAGIGGPSEPAVQGNFELGPSTPPAPDLAEMAAQGNAQAAEFLNYMQRGKAKPAEVATAVQAETDRADMLATQMSKAATIVQSDAFPEISGQTQLDDMAVARAQQSTNPGGHNVVQGVLDPAEMVRSLGANARFARRGDRLDVIFGDDPLPPKAVEEYEKWGAFTGQKVSTMEGLTGKIHAVDAQGRALIVPENAGTPFIKQISHLHPWLESPQSVEAPGLWDAFNQYADQRLATTQQAMGGALTPRSANTVRTQNLAQWVEDFFDGAKIEHPGDRARLREYFNSRWVDSFKDHAPAEIAQQQAAVSDLHAEEAANELQPIQHLDAHASTKGFLVTPKEGGKVELVDQVAEPKITGQAQNPGDPPPMTLATSGGRITFNSQEAAETWLKQVNRELPDITPAGGEVPPDIIAVHPRAAMQQPNLNEQEVAASVEATREAEEMVGGPPSREPPVEVHGAQGNLGRLQSRFEAAISRFAPMRRVMSAVDEVAVQEGKNYGLAQRYDRLGVQQNYYHTAMEPFQAELADLLAPVTRKRLVSGEWAQAYETTDAGVRNAFVQSKGWSPKEIESLDAFDGLMQKLFPETGLDEIRQIPRYFSHIAQRQSNPELLPRAFDDFSLGETTRPFYEFARTGNLNFRELDPRKVGDAYIRSVMWQKYMAETYNEAKQHIAQLVKNDPVAEQASNLMGSYLDIVRGGYHPKDDFALEAVHEVLKKLVDPAITRGQAKELVLGGMNSSYAGLIGYRPNMIARHFLQLTYAIPRAGTDMIATLGAFLRSPDARASIVGEAIADGAISPRAFTRAAPGSLQSSMERIGAGLQDQGLAGSIEPVEHTARYNAIAAVQSKIEDAMPDALKGQGDSIFRPMGAFSKAVERFKSIVYVAGKRKAAAALAEFDKAGPAGDLEKLMYDSGAATYDPSWQRQFKELVATGNDDEAAKFLGRQLVDATFFKYGTPESPLAAKSVTGKVALQLGHYELNYLQYLRESWMNGVPEGTSAFNPFTANRVKLLATIGTTTAALEAASRKTGWNFRWLNPFFALGFGGGPALGMIVAAGSGVVHIAKAFEGEDISNYDKGTQGLTQASGAAWSNLTPFGGLVRGAEGIGNALRGPNPAAGLTRYAVTGEVGAGPDIENSLLPQAQATFQNSLQPYSSPVRSNAVALPPGQYPQQNVVDPPIMQDVHQMPQYAPPTGSTPQNQGSGTVPGGVESFPRVYPFYPRR